MPKLEGKLGVDFVFFDGEEYVFEDGHPYFIGSEYFAPSYAGRPQGVRYRWAVLLDMVGDSDLQIVPDSQTMSWADSRPLVASIWKTAEQLGVTEFDVNRRCDVLDDHIKLHDIGKIPSCDLIDFRYPWWHTEQDRARTVFGVVAGQGGLGVANVAGAGRTQVANRAGVGRRHGPGVRHVDGYFFSLRGTWPLGDLSGHAGRDESIAAAAGRQRHPREPWRWAWR